VAGPFVSLDGVVEMSAESAPPLLRRRGRGDHPGRSGRGGHDPLGRRTYEEFAAHWPGKIGADAPFADYINRTRKVVASTTPKSVDWHNTTLIADGVARELTELKLKAVSEGLINLHTDILPLENAGEAHRRIEVGQVNGRILLVA
jgi:hypothetical protein